MPRVELPVRQLKLFDGAAGVGEFEDTFTAGDAVDFNQCDFTGREQIVARNVGATARTLTIVSVPDPLLQRTGDIATYSIGAGKQITVDFLPLAGFRQSNGKLYLNPSNAEIEFSIKRLPPVIP